MNLNQETVMVAVEKTMNFEDCFNTSSGRLIFVFDGYEELTEIEIVPNASADQMSRQGIHLTSIEDETDLAFRLGDALETCFRDGFTTIYIHEKAA